MRIFYLSSLTPLMNSIQTLSWFECSILGSGRVVAFVQIPAFFCGGLWVLVRWVGLAAGRVPNIGRATSWLWAAEGLYNRPPICIINVR